jgi:hypothetical protein
MILLYSSTVNVACFVVSPYMVVVYWLAPYTQLEIHASRNIDQPGDHLDHNDYI